ncbi:hypothetical protein HC762_01455 [bacterium]|nr:hypothetical protein [bacterium]
MVAKGDGTTDGKAPRVLFYGTGGLAYGSIKTTGTLKGIYDLKEVRFR